MIDTHKHADRCKQGPYSFRSKITAMRWGLQCKNSLAYKRTVEISEAYLLQWIKLFINICGEDT